VCVCVSFGLKMLRSSPREQKNISFIFFVIVIDF
jgi:hypothetical protein